MADDRPAYRPRRAFAEDAPTPERPTTDPATTSSPATPEPVQTPVDQGPGRFTEDEARPIFREDAPDADASTVRTPSSSSTSSTGAPDASGASDASDASGSDGEATSAETADGPRTNRLNFAPRARPADEESTTLLPRTTARETRDEPPFDPDDLDDRPRRLGRRSRLALLVGAVAAVVAVGLAIGYAVVGVRDQPGATGSPSPGTSASTAAPTATALLDDASMLSPEVARRIDAKRTWSVGGTVRGPIPTGSGASCLGSDPLEGAPTAQQTITRTLTSSGKDAPGALHIAQAYASPEDATQAFAVTSRALGTCAVTGDWLSNGRALQGMGDEAAAAGVRSQQGGETTLRWVVVSRTGRALDIVDASTPGKTPLNVNGVVQALAAVLGAQCQTAAGTCPANVSTKDAPPPLGGDEPGFLATGDLPPVGSGTAPWVGTPVEPPSADFTGSQCETVNWSTTSATAKSSRVYLLQDVPGIFGLNEVVLTEKDAATASKLVDKIKSDWASCKERKLTATVAAPTRVTGVGNGGDEVSGWTTQVEQKAGSSTTRFRVGIAAAGTKVAFVFVNPQKGLDLSADDWNVVTVRAVQRQTQQS